MIFQTSIYTGFLIAIFDYQLFSLSHYIPTNLHTFPMFCPSKQPFLDGNFPGSADNS